MIRPHSSRMQEIAVFALLVFSILWRGGKSLDATWALTGIACLVTLAWYVERKTSPTQTVLRVPVAAWWTGMAFVLTVCVSFLLSRTRNYGLDEVFRAGALFLLFVWAARHRYRELFASRLLHVIAITGLLACIVGFAVYLHQPVSRFVGTFFDARFHTDYWPNAWAQFLLIAWPAGAFSLSFSPRMRMLRPVILGIFIGALLLSYSRGALIAFSGQAFLLGAVMLIRRRKFSPSASFIGGVLLASVVAVLTFSTMNTLRATRFPVESVGEKVTFTSAEGASSISERAQFWRQSFSLSLEHPLTGWGPYSFRFVQPRLQSEVLATSDHAHNLFLKTAMEYGWLALALLVAFLCVVLVPSVRSIVLSDSASDQELMRNAYAAVAALGVLAHNLIDFNLQFVGVALPFWLLLGTLVKRESLASKRENTMRRTMEVTLACALLITALIEGRYLVLSSLGRRAEAREDAAAAMHWYDRSNRQLFSRDLHLSRVRLHMRDGDTNRAREALDDYMAVNAEDARAWKLMGDLSEGQESRRAYERAFALGRYNDLSITYGMIHAMAESGVDIPDETKEDIDALMLAFADAILRNAHFIALSSNVEHFLSVSDLLADLFPDDAPRYQILAAQVDRHARQERETYRSRSGGILW